MKLAKALKEKNRLAGEITRLKNLIQRENSRNVKSSSKVDVAALWKNMVDTTDKLVALKTAIFKANAGIYSKIVCMAELKGRASWITGLNTNNERTEQLVGMSGQIVVTEYQAYMTREGVDKMTKDLQDEISKLQDELDEYNATVTIEV